MKLVRKRGTFCLFTSKKYMFSSFHLRILGFILTRIIIILMIFLHCTDGYSFMLDGLTNRLNKERSRNLPGNKARRVPFGKI